MAEIKAEETALESSVAEVELEEDIETEESIFSDSNMAVIVSFLDQFGNLIFPDNAPIMSDLVTWINNTDEVPQELVDLHVKLLRKLKKSVVMEKWEKSIVKFCYFYGGVDDAFEIERYGYLHSSSSIKLRILKNLLEMQFDVNLKFKNIVNAMPTNGLRIEPFGQDKDGNFYYVQIDIKANIKVYLENLDEENWIVVASNREELVKLIEELKGNKPIRQFPKDLIDEDSSSNSRLSAKEEGKTETITVADPEEKKTTAIAVEATEQEYSINNSVSDEFPLKQTIRLIKKPEVTETQSSEEVPEEKTTPEKGSAQKKRRRK